MKHFDSFILEARTTAASAQAKRMGWVGDGHGDWYDRQGNLRAKTVRGELEIYNGFGSRNDDGNKNQDLALNNAKRTSDKAQDALGISDKPGQPTDQMQRQYQQLARNTAARKQFDASARREPLTIAFDKFDDEEIADNVVLAAAEAAGDSPYYIFPSREADIDGLKEMYGDVIVDSENAETIYDVLQSVYESGYNAVNIVVRKSRAQEIGRLALQQNGDLYNYVMMNIIPVDERSIREQYHAGDIFNEGDIILHEETEGKIVRRGANHLICLGEEGIFRAFINDVVSLNKTPIIELCKK